MPKYLPRPPCSLLGGDAGAEHEDHLPDSIYFASFDYLDGL